MSNTHFKISAQSPSIHVATLCLLTSLLAITGCATLSPDGNTADIQQLTSGKTAGGDFNLMPVNGPDANAQEVVAKLLLAPLSEHEAVQIALLNSPSLQASLSTLGISDAQRVQAGRPPNPHLTLARLREGEAVDIERMLTFNVVGLITLPWKAEWASQQHELAKLQAAQDVIALAANTRKAWITAVAAQQTAAYMSDVRDAAEAGGELARRMARIGNWSKLRQAKEQLKLAEANAQLARAQQVAHAEREKLTRLMGLTGEQARFTLRDRLPDLPKNPEVMPDVEARALQQRLDVKSARAESGYVARQLGLTQAVGYLDGLTLSAIHNTRFDNAQGIRDTTRGFEVELPLPLFDWGGARNAQAKGLYMQSVARVREVALTARSEAREAYFAYRTAFDLARHYRDEVVPLRQFINEETVLRYNGNLASVWDLLADTSLQILSVNSAIDALRDFWLAEADLQTTLTGTSPGTLSRMNSNPGAMAADGAAVH